MEFRFDECQEQGLEIKEEVDSMSTSVRKKADLSTKSVGAKILG